MERRQSVDAGDDKLRVRGIGYDPGFVRSLVSRSQGCARLSVKTMGTACEVFLYCVYYFDPAS
jgi:hypothetical protein